MWTRVNIRTCVSSALSKLKTPELKITSPSKKWKLLEKTAIFGEESLTGCCWRKDFGQAQRLRKPRFLANWSKKLHSTLGPRPRVFSPARGNFSRPRVRRRDGFGARGPSGRNNYFQTSGLKKAFFATPLGVKNGAPHARFERSFFLFSDLTTYALAQGRSVFSYRLDSLAHF